MTTRIKRFFIAVVLFLIFVPSGFLAIFYSLLHLSLPDRDGTLRLSQLEHNVAITTDKMGLAQIWAESNHDGYFSLGYLHASDRLFQMELIRRVAHGRLSEMLGERTLSEDIRQHRAGHARLAAKAMKNLSEESRRRLQWYVDGINAYAEECSAFPIEYYLLQVDYESWTVEDCLTILSFQTWFSDALVNKDMLFLQIAEKVGVEKASTILTSYPDWAPVTVNRSSYSIIDVKKDNQYGVAGPDVLESSDTSTPSFFGNMRERIASLVVSDDITPLIGSYASNAWAVAPSKSQDGHALFASDPHLDVTRLPGFWYLAGLHIRESGTDIVGISTPGLPMIVMGHNQHCAFAFTAAGVDLTDIFHEKVNPNDSDQYVYLNDTLNFVHTFDTIRLAGADSVVVLDIRSTHNGPIVLEDDSTGEIYSLHWAGFESNLDAAVSAGFALHTAQSVDDFRSAVTSLGALNANWLYADTGGHIAYQLGAPIPMERRLDSRFPRDGSRDDNDWRGYYPMNFSPYIVDPPRGWVGNCNNRPDRGSSLYRYGGNFFVDRIMRLEQLMASKEKLTIDDMAKFQQDRRDVYLLRWRDLAVDLLNELGETELAKLLFDWDGNTRSDSRAVLLMELFMNMFKELTFADELGDLHVQMRLIWLDRIYHEGDQSWFDDTTTPDTIETSHDIALAAMRRAVKSAGDDTWGERHSLLIRHPLAAVPLLGELLNLTYGPYERGGTAGTINASFFRVTDNYNFETFVAPSWRMLVDFSDLNKTRTVLPAGNSGNPASPYFSNFVDAWRNGEYWIIPFDYQEVKNRATSALVLTP